MGIPEVDQKIAESGYVIEWMGQQEVGYRAAVAIAEKCFDRVYEEMVAGYADLLELIGMIALNISHVIVAITRDDGPEILEALSLLQRSLDRAGVGIMIMTPLVAYTNAEIERTEKERGAS